ncbi:MAG: NUDIX domain-containing protein [Lachnospiraceae bacterium]|nr:NUDIX domain-containing protein [Lachnospiraceae bacterium]
MIDIVIKNEDFGLEATPYTDNCYVRYASRGIVFDPAIGKIAMEYKANINEYKLPGGGREGNETEEETFHREVFEESGCKVKIVKKLGTILEERSNIDMKQYSAIFVAELVEDTKELHLEQKEADEGMVVKWMDVDEALEAVKKSHDTVKADGYESLYNAHFVLVRDEKIIEAYKESLDE